MIKVHMLLKHAGQWKNEEASSAMALKSIIKQQKKESKNMIQQLNIPPNFSTHSPNFSTTQSSTLIMKISKHLEQLEFTHQALLHSITPSDPIT